MLIKLAELVQKIRKLVSLIYQLIRILCSKQIENV